jgi:hypothetical protein
VISKERLHLLRNGNSSQQNPLNTGRKLGNFRKLSICGFQEEALLATSPPTSTKEMKPSELVIMERNQRLSLKDE